MTMTVSSRLGVVYELRPGLLEDTQALMRNSSKHGREAYCVWVGQLSHGRGLVEAVWPVAAKAGVAHAHVSLDDVLTLSDKVTSQGWFILAQVHTHPGSAFHSPVDDQHPISNKPGFISIVVPDFGKNPTGVGWAWFVLVGAGRWRELSDEEVARLFSRVRKGFWSHLWKDITARLRS
jgi:hypothetical protein